jgi:hypothetical protein
MPTVWLIIYGTQGYRKLFDKINIDFNKEKSTFAKQQSLLIPRASINWKHQLKLSNYDNESQNKKSRKDDSGDASEGLLRLPSKKLPNSSSDCSEENYLVACFTIIFY